MAATNSEAASKAVRLLGGPVTAARKLQIARYQTVQSWMQNGIPFIHCRKVETALAGAMNVQELRPEDWSDVWPDLPAPAAQEPAHG